MDVEHQSGIDRDIQQANVDIYQQLFEEMILNESRKTTQHQREMAEIEELLRSTGWIPLQREPSLSLNFKNESDFIDGSSYTPGEWAKVLASKKDELQQLRMQAMVDVLNTAPHVLNTAPHVPHSSQLIDVVKPVDQVFLTQKDQSNILSSDRELLDKVQLGYSLNSEQERAFKIIETHAISVNSPQFCMYIGGMAGTGKSQII